MLGCESKCTNGDRVLTALIIHLYNKKWETIKIVLFIVCLYPSLSSLKRIITVDNIWGSWITAIFIIVTTDFWLSWDGPCSLGISNGWFISYMVKRDRKQGCEAIDRHIYLNILSF